MLPNKDGFTIADEIRELNEEVPIIFLTAKTQTEDVVKGFSLGGNDYIRKPFSMEELIVRLHNLLALAKGGARPTPAPGEAVAVGCAVGAAGGCALSSGGRVHPAATSETTSTATTNRVTTQPRASSTPVPEPMVTCRRLGSPAARLHQTRVCARRRSAYVAIACTPRPMPHGMVTHRA